MINKVLGDLQEIRNRDDIQKFIFIYIIHACIILTAIFFIYHLIGGRMVPAITHICSFIIMMLIRLFGIQFSTGRWPLRVMFFTILVLSLFRAWDYNCFESPTMLTYAGIVIIPALSFRFFEALLWAMLTWGIMSFFFVLSYYHLYGFVNHIPLQNYPAIFASILGISVFQFMRPKPLG